MATPLIGNNMIAGSFRTNISSTTATGIVSGSDQVLSTPISANPTLGSNNYTYQWSQTGTIITFTAATSNSTNCIYNSLSVSGSTTIYCTVTDTWTGVQSVTANCVITWPVQTIPITAVTWSIPGATNSTYTGSAQSVTVISVSPVGAAYSTSTTTATNAGSVASSTIIGTGIYTGTFTSPNLTIVPLTITSMTFTLDGFPFTSDQSRTAGTSYTIAVSSVTPNGATYSPGSLTVSTVGTYQLNSFGTDNYQGSFSSPFLTLTTPPPTGSIDIINVISPTQVQLQATLSNATATNYSWSRVFVPGYYTGQVGIAPNNSGTSSQTTTVTANGAFTGNKSRIQCVMSYSGGTVTQFIDITWGAP